MMGESKMGRKSVLSFLIEELNSSQVLDPVEIVCKDRNKVLVSGVLLAVVCPHLASSFKDLESQEVVIYLPEVDSSSVKCMFDWVLGVGNYSDISDQAILRELNGTILNFDKTSDYDVSIKDEKIDNGFEIDSSLCLQSEDIKYEDLEEFPIKKDELSNALQKKNICKAKNKVTTTNLGQRTINKPRKRKPILDIDNKAKRTKISSTHDRNAQDKSKLKMSPKRTSTRTIRQTAKAIEYSEQMICEVDDILPSDVSTAEEFKDLKDNISLPNITSKKDNHKSEAKTEDTVDLDDLIDAGDDNLAEDESNGDEEENSAVVKQNNLDPLERKKRKKSEFGSSYISEADMPKDEKFVFAQERLKAALEDANNHEDPRKLWHQLHGYNQHTKFHKTKPDLICPICSLSFPLLSRGRIFFFHIQDHKFKRFNCDCLPPAGKPHEIRKHVKLKHWGWKECDLCHDMVDPQKFVRHMSKKHYDSRKDLVCGECGETFITARYYKYQLHLEQHKADKYECDCDVVIKSRRQKLHHVQAVHVKEMHGCEKCFFVFYDKTSMEEHFRMKHVIRENTSLVCDICGFETKTMNNRLLKEHKLRIHDLVLLQCPHCPVKLNSFALKEHIKLSHEGAGICNICGVQVTRLKMHMKSKHVPAHLLKHKCQYCPKAFYYSGDMKRHVMSVHLKERPFKCRYGCEFAYNDSSNRNQHEKKKHGAIFTKADVTVKDE